ncbi:hypothetical protein L218DRAFT_871214, partial [Marasmius fiardii PR-910]
LRMGTILACSHIRFQKEDGKTHIGPSRLIISEAAFLLWKMRNQKQGTDI